jgi:hypothetical protein
MATIAPLLVPQQVDYRYRRANKIFEPVRRAALHCYNCLKTSQGRNIQHWKYCPYCGALTEKQPKHFRSAR